MSIRKINKKVITLVDTQTGEVIDEKAQVGIEIIKKVDSQHFFQSYVEFLAPIFKLQGNTVKLLFWMLCNAEYNTGKVIISAQRRDQIAEDTGISKGSISRNLNILKENNIISGEKGTFIINPQLFWVGDINTRNLLLSAKDVKFSMEVLVNNKNE